MPVENVSGRLPSPWKEFLTKLDGMLKDPLELHCIGGFVLVHFYGFPRTTAISIITLRCPPISTSTRLLGKAHLFTRNTESGCIE